MSLSLVKKNFIGIVILLGIIVAVTTAIIFEPKVAKPSLPATTVAQDTKDIVRIAHSDNIDIYRLCDGGAAIYIYTSTTQNGSITVMDGRGVGVCNGK